MFTDLPDLGAELNAPIFISYSRRNRDFAQALYAKLEANGFKLWRDVHEITAGGDWWAEIKNAIENSDTLVLCISLPALQSPVVSDEWNYARQLGKRVIPIIADEVFQHEDVKNGTFHIPHWMTRTNWMDFRPGIPEREFAWQRFIKTLNTLYEPRRVTLPKMATELPPTFVPRPHEFEPLVHALISETQDAIAITAALKGAGGFGKTTLAKALCRDLRINGAFDDGIFWVTLGESLLDKSGDALQNELLSRVRDLILSITGSPSEAVRLEAAREELAFAIGDRYILLVIDDVWHSTHLKPFLVQGQHNATLLTTRDSSTIPAQSFQRTVDTLRPAEAYALLTAGLQATEIAGLLPAFAQLEGDLGGWALLIELVNGSLRRHLDHGRTVAAALQQVIDDLKDEGFAAFDYRQAAERNQAITSSLNVSLRALSDDECQQYEQLGIFPDDTSIPITTLACMWDLKPRKALRFCETLADLSLLQFDVTNESIRLHDVIRQVIAARLPNPAAVHQQLLERWGDFHALSDSYAWRHLAYHLQAANRLDNLRSLLFNYGFLQAKLDATDAGALISDCELFPSDPDVALLHSFFGISAHILNKDTQALPAQLVGRLQYHQEKPTLQTLLNTVQPTFGYYQPINLCFLPADSPLLKVLEGHTCPVTGALVLADGNILSWARRHNCRDNTLRLWSPTGEPLAVLEAHTDGVTGALALPDTRILSWSQDCTLRLWSPTGEPLAVLEGHTQEVNGALALSNDRILSWSSDHTLRLWNDMGEPLAVLEAHTDGVTGALALPDTRILSWSQDCTLRLWSPTGEPLALLEGHTGSVIGALALSDGRFLSWAGGHYCTDHTLRLWSSTGEPLAVLEGHTWNVDGALEFPDGRILSWSYTPKNERELMSMNYRDESTLRVWDSMGKPLAKLAGQRGHHKGITGALALPNGQILSWSKDQTLRLWSRSGEPLATLRGHTESVTGALVLRDGRFLSWSNDNTLRFWSPTGEPLAVLQGHTDRIEGVLVLSDGRFLSWSDDGTLRLWNGIGAPSVESNKHTSAVINLSIMPQNQLLSWSRDKTLRVWSETGELLTELKGHNDSVNGALVLSDRRFLSWSDDHTLRLWSEVGERLAILNHHTGGVKGAIVLPSGQFLSWASTTNHIAGNLPIPNDETLFLWSSTGEKLAEMKEHTQGVKGAVALPDGRFLSWANGNSSLRLWSSMGKLLAVLEGHRWGVNGVLVLADGRFLSWSNDHTLRLWSNTGKPLSILEGHTGGVAGVSVLSNDCFVSWARDPFFSNDYTLRIWNETGELIAVMEGHTNHIQGLLALPDSRILSWAWDHTLRLWRKDGTPLTVLEGHTGNVDGALVLSNGRILSWSDDNTLRLWSTEGKPLSVFYADAPITCCVQLPNGTIAAGDRLGNVLFLCWVE